MSASCDIWNSNIEPMTPAKNESKWNKEFLETNTQGKAILLRTVNNFLYLRIWNVKSDNDMVEMFASTKAGLYAPQNNWFHLKTAMGEEACAIAVNEEACLGANVDPFIVSGLYDWTDYVFIAHVGTQAYELESEIDASFFEKPGWATVELSMNSSDPFILIYSVLKKFLAGTGIKTSINPFDVFTIELSDSRIRNLNAEREDDGISYEGVGSTRVLETLTLYLVLNPNEQIPENVCITTEATNDVETCFQESMVSQLLKLEGENVMSNTLDYLNFTKQVRQTAKYGYYTTYRSKMIDCGRTHRERSGEKGGNIEWTEWPLVTDKQNSLKIPIYIDYDKKEEDTHSGGGWNPGSYPAQDGWVQESPEVDIDYPGIIISTNAISPEATKDYMLKMAFDRKLSPNTKVNLSAFVNYSTDEAVQSDAFVVYFYYASVNYIRIPTQWVPLSPSGDQYLEYDSVAPNTIACPKNNSTIEWQTPGSGYLIVRISDVTGTYNPKPTSESGMMIDENWFSEQRNWAKIEIR